ncbi:Lysophospholipid acyltransferase LPEAT1 [Porphyridium purpureum]|uniref:Lysophospholipid acyltransferase LPEAT1 n=1 Tax=Porphyridium purpureum TaxID=35688 RepID=A0A5J4YSY2_PORPP|nr:Lysophospholipid acyltransferase LPEAT1 [Porphyridium purpureum]|eukprot:POR5973..scf229_5
MDALEKNGAHVVHEVRDEFDPIFDAFRRDIPPYSWLDFVKFMITIPLLPLRVANALFWVFACYFSYLTFGPRLTKQKKRHSKAVAANDAAQQQTTRANATDALGTGDTASERAAQPSNSTSNSVELVPAYRQKILTFCGRFCARMMLLSFGFVRVAYVDEPGYDYEEAKHYTVCSNHVSMIDILVFMSYNMPSFVAKESVSHIPLVGRIATAAQSLYVDRLSSGAGNVTEKIIQRQRALAELQDDKTPVAPLLIFPEGTTENGKCLIPFRSGAFVAGYPVSVYILKYPYSKLSPSYDTINGGWLILRLLTEMYNSVEIHRFKPYYPSEAEKKDAKLYAKKAAAYFADKGGLGLSEGSFPDKLEYFAIVRGTKLPAWVIPREQKS